MDVVATTRPTSVRIRGTPSVFLPSIAMVMRSGSHGSSSQSSSSQSSSSITQIAIGITILSELARRPNVS